MPGRRPFGDPDPKGRPAGPTRAVPRNMANVIGIPNTRVSDLFVQQRLLSQVTSDQVDLFRIQTQLSTGRRILTPSDDPVAAMRALSLQRLLERKDQVKTNLTTNQSFLSATDTALSSVSSMMADVRAAALGVIGTVASDEQCKAAAQQVQQAIQQLMDTGNQNFRGRYLFAGSLTGVRPFESLSDNVVKYLGNEGLLQSYADIDLLFATNLTGNEVFGAISNPVRGTADLDPVLTYDTRLADLNAGKGVKAGSIEISNGNDARIIDITGCETIGDVAARMLANQPSGSQLFVEITPKGLEISLSAGTLSIKEVGGGTTASELGILCKQGTSVFPLVGRDLDPIVRATTLLDDAFGARARAVVRSLGSDSDVIVTARSRGPAFNGVTVRYYDDGTVLDPGDEFAWYDPDPLNPTVWVNIKSGYTEAKDVVAAINAAYDPLNPDAFPFEAALDPLDEVDGGRGKVTVTASAGLRHGSGFEFDQDSGVQIVNGNKTYTLTFARADGIRTVEDLLNVLNGSEANVLASINAAQTGVDVRSRLSGCDFTIGENGGQTAAQLGLRTFDEATRLDDLGFGLGVADYTGSGAQASVLWDSAGANADFVVRARATGAQWNGFSVSFVQKAPPGPETLDYDPVAKTMVFEINPGTTTANDVIRLLQNTPGACDDFEIVLDTSSGAANDGTGVVAVGPPVRTAGGFDADADFLITRTDGVTFEINVQGAVTIGDVLYRINHDPVNLASGTPLTARLAQYGNGIELVDNSAGPGTLTVTRTTLSRAAIDLGLVPEGQTSATFTAAGMSASAAFDFGVPDSGLVVRSRGAGSGADGVEVRFEDGGPGANSYSYDPGLRVLTFSIDAGVTSANEVISRFNQQPPLDETAYALFTVELDTSSGPNNGTGAVDVLAEFLSGGEPDLLTGRDANPQETDGLFTALLRLHDGLIRGDDWEIERAVAMLDARVVDLNFSRAALGARQQGLDILSQRLDDEDLQLRSTLSLDLDVDMVEAISTFVARQAAYEASLQSIAQIFQLSLLDYL